MVSVLRCRYCGKEYLLTAAVDKKRIAEKGVFIDCSSR